METAGLDLVALVERLGLPAAVTIWFLVKDWRFTGRQIALMEAIKVYLQIQAREGRGRDTSGI